jgi:hypothetical protein
MIVVKDINNQYVCVEPDVAFGALLAANIQIEDVPLKTIIVDGMLANGLEAKDEETTASEEEEQGTSTTGDAATSVSA